MTKPLQVINQQGKAVDWWFIYKTPECTGRDSNQGYDFFYYDDQTDLLELSSASLESDKQALAYTLQSIFDSPSTAGYISYNDEHVDNTENVHGKGHCKGVLAFDSASDSALLLLHSTPRYPVKDKLDLPEDERAYGQTFLAITLPNYQTANLIAAQMLKQQNPQVLAESSRLPAGMKVDEPLSQLFRGENIDEQYQPSTVNFTSKGGKAFSLIAKSRKWGEDFWLDLVAPQLECDLVVETWRRGKVTPMSDGRSDEFDEDVLSLKFNFGDSTSYEWKYTKDHAKWAVALKNANNQKPWVCVGDINRMVSQEKRGGGAICFEDEALWQTLQQAEEKLHQPATS